MERWRLVQSARQRQCHSEAWQTEMRYSSSPDVRSTLPMRSQASLKHCAEKKRCATARSKGGAVVMRVSGPPRVGAQRQPIASHRTAVLVYRAIGADRHEGASAEGARMGTIT